MSQEATYDLSGVRDYNTDDGEEYWTIGPLHALEAVVNELNGLPVVRGLNPTTGEIVQGPFAVLLNTFGRWLKDGHDFRVEMV